MTDTFEEVNKAISMETARQERKQASMDELGKISLWISDEKSMPWVGEHINARLKRPILDQGALADSEKGFLIALARIKINWQPHNMGCGTDCRPQFIHEAMWIWLEAGQPYYRFAFSPPLEVWDDAGL